MKVEKDNGNNYNNKIHVLSDNHANFDDCINVGRYLWKELIDGYPSEKFSMALLCTAPDGEQKFIGFSHAPKTEEI